MARVVPSLVVSIIDGAFPFAAEEDQVRHSDVYLSYNHAAILAAISALVDQIPGELVTLEGNEYARFVFSVSAIQEALRTWPSRAHTH